MPPTTMKTTNSPSSQPLDLKSHYQNYVSALNARSWDILSQFVADGVIHNGRSLGSVAGYEAMLRDDISKFPGLTFEVEEIVVEQSQEQGTGSGSGMVATRIKLTCQRPPPPPPAVAKEAVDKGVHGKAEAEAEGGTVEFMEHVFYKFVDGKMVQVWSMVELPWER